MQEQGRCREGAFQAVGNCTHKSRAKSSLCSGAHRSEHIKSQFGKGRLGKVCRSMHVYTHTHIHTKELVGPKIKPGQCGKRSYTGVPAPRSF